MNTILSTNLSYSTSPLEQFEIISIVNFFIGSLDFSITNSTFYLLTSFFVVIGLMDLTLRNRELITNSWHFILESILDTSVGLVLENIGEKGKKHILLIFPLFAFLIGANLLGMVPYSFTTTSHLIFTFSMALFVFTGINIICIQLHKLNFFSLFLPPGSTVALAFILVPIEIVSYFFRVISLPVRLFANMMAGHTLLKVIAGFAWTMMSLGGIMFVFHYVPLLLLNILIGLEVGVALIQAYVFAILTCMYLNDAVNLH